MTNGAGLKFSHNFGFGAIDAEAMVTRARHWINVPSQETSSTSVDGTRYCANQTHIHTLEVE